MLLKFVKCNNHITICSNKDLLLKVVLFLTDNYKRLEVQKGIVTDWNERESNVLLLFSRSRGDRSRHISRDKRVLLQLLPSTRPGGSNEVMLSGSAQSTNQTPRLPFVLKGLGTRPLGLTETTTLAKTLSTTWVRPEWPVWWWKYRQATVTTRNGLHLEPCPELFRPHIAGKRNFVYYLEVWSVFIFTASIFFLFSVTNNLPSNSCSLSP